MSRANQQTSQRSNGIDWWDEETVAAQLRKAVTMLDCHCSQQPIQRDFDPHWENVSAWVAITSGHLLVEQSLKAVLREWGSAKANQRGVAGHNLGDLYAALPLPLGDQRVVERELKAFALQSGGTPPWRGVAEYLYSVGQDNVRWRYLLIESPPQDLATTHPQAMLGVAKGVVLVLKGGRVPLRIRLLAAAKRLVHSLVHLAKVVETKRSHSESRDGPVRTNVQSRGTATARAKGERKWRDPEESLVHGLEGALRSLKRHLGKNHRFIDSADPGKPQEVASAWIAVSCGYSLLEQAIKWRLHKCSRDTQTAQSGSGGHLVDKLYEKLCEKDKEVVERGFAVYKSLFDGIPDTSASRFLGRVGHSYNEWRYLLVERPRRPLSPMYPGALVEVAGLVVEILVNKTFTDHGMHDVARRLHDLIRSNIQEALSHDKTLELVEKGLPQEGIPALDDWLREPSKLLNGYAAYLRGETPESELAANVLQRAHGRLKKEACGPDGLDLRQFIKRARHSDGQLSWDASKGLFVAQARTARTKG